MAVSLGEVQPGVCSEIVGSIVQSIKNGDPTEEIRDMLIESATFRNTLREWKDEQHQLNALQCAIVHRHAGAVKLLSTWDFSYQTLARKKKTEAAPASEPTAPQPERLMDLYQNYKEKQHRIQKLPATTNGIVTVNGDTFPEKQAQFQKLIEDSQKVKINSPVHLACKVGDLDILKIFVQKEDTIESQLLLNEKSVVLYSRPSPTTSVHPIPVKEDKDGSIVYDGKSNRVVLPASTQICTDVNKNEKFCTHPGQIAGDGPEVKSSDSSLEEEVGVDEDVTTEESRHDLADRNRKAHNTASHEENVMANHGNETPILDNIHECVPSEGNESADEGQTPFEVCVEQKQLQCASYLARILYDLKRPTAFVKRNRQPVLKRNWQPFMVQEIDAPPHRDNANYSRFYFGETTVKGSNPQAAPVQNKSLLHIACFLGNAAYLDLLLRNGFRSVINERDDISVPPLFVAIASSVECLKLLLMHGADVNATVTCQNALHKLYDESTEENRLMADCTEALIWAGINVNAQDSNSSTPLDYLASDFSKESLQMTQHGRFVTLAERNQHARKCMELLLEAGARVQVATPSGTHIDHTVGHTLLLNTSWPVSSFFSKRPNLVYMIMELYFSHGLDPNILPVNNETNLFSQLLAVMGHCLSTFEDELQTKFVHLFIINGAEVNRRIPPPKLSLDAGPIRIWNVYPLIMALQEKLPIGVLETMGNFMSLSALSDCVVAMAEGQTWLQFEMMRGSGLAPGTAQAGTNSYASYKTGWDNLARVLQTSVRSLRHCTKLVILDSLNRKGSLVLHLPIPKAMQTYLCSEQC